MLACFFIKGISIIVVKGVNVTCFHYYFEYSIIKSMKKYLLWLTELFIWLLILVLVSGVIMFARYNYKKDFNTYQIFLPDVDGLIIGSPVRLMGVQVGYVNQLNMVGQDVYVKFIITSKDTKLPRGSFATVEFAGLGGSKSLELYPPSEKTTVTTTKLIIAQSPKRIHDSLGLLVDMFDQFAGIAYNVSHFMDEVGIIKTPKPTINACGKIEINDILKKSNEWLDNASNQCSKFSERIKKNGKKNGKKDKNNERK